MFYVLCLNIAITIITGLNLAGTEYTQPQASLNTSDFESTYNSTEIAEGWQPGFFDVLAGIFAGFQFFFTHIHWLIVGFPMFLYSLGDTYIVDATVRTQYNLFIVAPLVALFVFLMSFWFIEYIGGRYFTD